MRKAHRVVSSAVLGSSAPSDTALNGAANPPWPWPQKEVEAEKKLLVEAQKKAAEAAAAAAAAAQKGKLKMPGGMEVSTMQASPTSRHRLAFLLASEEKSICGMPMPMPQ